ncbi:unnamed protein product [Prunus armeniaca]
MPYPYPPHHPYYFAATDNVFNNFNDFRVGGYKNLKSLPQRIHILTALQSLRILGLPNLVSFAEKRLRPSVGFVSLQKFTIGGRESGDILEALRNSIWELSSLNSLDEKGLGHLTSLQVLNILQCDSLEFLQGEGLGHHTSLQVLHILQCSSLECLQGDGLRHLTSLQQIHIYGCLSLQFLPEDSFFSEISPFVCLGVKSLSKRIHTLAALQHLSICDLPNLESFAEDGGLPPDLLYFTIENCNRLRASVGEHWDLQGLVSLEEFTIGGRGSDDILEMLLKQQLLPSTLYILHINRLSSLKSLDRKGLKNITSLSFLSISKCFSREKRYKRRQEKIGPTYLTFLASR